MIIKNLSCMNLTYNFFNPPRKAAVLNSLSEAARSLLPGGLQCQLPTPLFTVLGGGPAIKGVHSLPFAPGAHDSKARGASLPPQAPARQQALLPLLLLVVAWERGPHGRCWPPKAWEPGVPGSQEQKRVGGRVAGSEYGSLIIKNICCVT